MFLGGLGLVALVGGLLGAGLILFRSSEGNPGLALIPIFFAGLGIYLIAAVAVERLVLFEDAIELVELGRRKRRVRRDEIQGLRIVPLQYGYRQLVLELRSKKKVKITWVHETDAALQEWLGSIQNLDAEEHARAEAELLRSAALGANPAERARALARARKIAKVRTGVSVAACLWGWFHPRPYTAAIVALSILPLLGIVTLLGGRGRYSFDRRMNDPRPSLGAMVLLPGLVLGLRAILDVNLIDWKALLAGAALGAVALTIVIALGERVEPRKRWALILLAPLLMGYSWGALSLGNALLDRAPPEVFRVAVRNKTVASSRNHTSWNLELDPWGPVVERKNVDVGRRIYGTVSVGDRVCVALYPGVLGARWYIVRPCRDG